MIDYVTTKDMSPLKWPAPLSEVSALRSGSEPFYTMMTPMTVASA
jgi:hypothetical protein